MYSSTYNGEFDELKWTSLNKKYKNLLLRTKLRTIWKDVDLAGFETNLHIKY